MSIFEGTGISITGREYVNNSGFLLSRKQNPVLYFDLRTSPILVEPCRRRDDSRTALPCRDLE
jgi:hypothetical protein